MTQQLVESLLPQKERCHLTTDALQSGRGAAELWEALGAADTPFKAEKTTLKGGLIPSDALRNRNIFI